MAGEVERLSGKLGLDTTDFKTSVRSADRELRVLESGFKASAAALGDWTQDATGMELRVKSLTSQIDIQKLKVDALRAEHARLAEEHGATSKAAQDAEIKINKETETLNKMDNELQNTEASLEEMRNGEQEAGDAADEMGAQVEESGSKVEKFKSILSGVGAVTKGVITGVLAVGTAAITAVAAMGTLGINAATTAEHFADLSTKTGISVETLQEMNYASDLLGTSLDTVTGAQARLVRTMSAAQQGGKQQEEAFNSLGVSVTDASGQLRDSEEVFADTLDALGRIPNEAERDALAMEIFGKSAQELNPLIKAGSAEINRLKNEAHELGAVMSEEDVEAASAFKDELDGLKLGFQGIVAQIGLAFIPGLSGVVGQAKGYLGELVGIVQGSGGDVGKIAEGLGSLLGKIVTDLAAQAPQLLQVGLNLIQSLLNSIINALPTLLPAAVEIITSLVQFIVQALPTLIDAGVAILLMLVNVIIQNLPMLIEAALQAIIALATGLAAALPELIPAVVLAIITIVQTLIENLPLLVDAALQLIMALAQGLIVALPILIQSIPVLLDALIAALLLALPMLATTAGELIGALALGIIANLPVIIDAAGQILAMLFETLSSSDVSLKSIGQDFVRGLVEGIESAAGWLYNAVSNVVNNMIDTITSALGISSPSKVGRNIGHNLFQSQGMGAMDALREVENTFALATRRLVVAMATGTSGVGQTSQSSVQNDQFQFFAPVVIQGETPSGSLGSSLRGRRY